MLPPSITKENCVISGILFLLPLLMGVALGRQNVTAEKEAAMATPIAHQGVLAGAKVQALTILDLLLRPELVAKAWGYFNNVQTKDMKYKSLLRPDDKPAIWLNQKTMEEWRPPMKRFYYDPSRYDTYLDQLGIKYPTVRR
jgi:aminobenzoyl-glutamate utilization protein B